MSAASDNLKSNQRQLDMDGCEVGVSRQAVDETTTQYDAMLEALELLQGFDFRLDESPHGVEIRKRAVAAIDAAKSK